MCVRKELRNIIPRIEENQMIIFDKIETAFIKENGIEVLKRDSGEKTIERA